MEYQRARLTDITRRAAAATGIALSPILASLTVTAMTPHDTAAQAVAPHEGSMQSSAFEERRSRGVGIFFTGRQLEHGQKRTLGDLLRRVPGMPAPRSAADDQSGSSQQTASVWGGATPSYASNNARGRYGSEFSALNGCPVVFYLNGMRVNRGTEVTPTDIADLYAMPTETLSAVEVYRGPSEIPLELSGADARCAVVGLWTQPQG